MIGIIKKDVRIYILYFLMISIFPILNISMDGMERSVVTGLGNMMMLSVIMGVCANELIEDKYSGYKVLKNIPITDFQIVSGKFFLILIFSIINVVFDLILIKLFSETMDFFILSRAYIVVFGCFCLIFSSLILYFVFKFGFTKFVKIVAFGFPVIFMVMPLILLSIFGKVLRSMDLTHIVNISTIGNLVFIFFVSMVLFVLIFRLSVEAKKKMEVI